MPKGTKILTDVPKDECDAIVKGLEAEGAKVTVKEQPDGNFTITAIFPDSNAGDTQAKSSSSSLGKTKPSTGASP